MARVGACFGVVVGSLLLALPTFAAEPGKIKKTDFTSEPSASARPSKGALASSQTSRKASSKKARASQQGLDDSSSAKATSPATKGETTSADLRLAVADESSSAQGSRRPSKAALASDKAASQALFDEAVRLMDRENYKEACPKLEASQDLDPGVGTLLYLADCYENLGRRASAWATFREAESLARANGQHDRAELAATRAKALDEKLSHLTLVVPIHARVEGLRIRLGHRIIPVATVDQPLPIDPGRQVLEVTAPGHQPYYRTLYVTDDGPHDYRVVVPTLLPAPTSGRGTTLRTLGVVTGAVGIAAVGAGAVLGIMAAERNADATRYCPQDAKGCTERGVELQRDASGFTTAAKGSLAAGGSLILTGIVLYVAAPTESEQEQVAAVKRVKLTPMLGSRWGASVNASF